MDPNGVLHTPVDWVSAFSFKAVLHIDIAIDNVHVTTESKNLFSYYPSINQASIESICENL